jgi:hypothetical protein
VRRAVSACAQARRCGYSGSWSCGFIAHKHPKTYRHFCA